MPAFSLSRAVATPVINPDVEPVPESGAEEKAVYREKCAAALVSVLPPYSLK